MTGVDLAGLRGSVVAACRRASEQGLVIGTAGNVSARDGDRVAVTATGADFAQIADEHVVVVDLDGRLVDGDLEPTSELDLHLGLHRLTDGGSAVVHTHAPVSTAMSTVLDELPVIHYQQLLLGGPVRVAAYATFGSAALAEHVRHALDGRQAALMANHGSVAVGSSLAAAVDNALLLEWLAALHHRASALGTPRALTEQEQEDVVTAALSRGYGAPRANGENA
jgi:L-fuculose-phosphate aldolase